MRQPPFSAQPVSKKHSVGGPQKGHNVQHHVFSVGGFLHFFKVNEIQLLDSLKHIITTKTQSIEYWILFSVLY